MNTATMQKSENNSVKQPIFAQLGTILALSLSLSLSLSHEFALFLKSFKKICLLNTIVCQTIDTSHTTFLYKYRSL